MNTRFVILNIYYSQWSEICDKAIEPTAINIDNIIYIESNKRKMSYGEEENFIHSTSDGRIILTTDSIEKILSEINKFKNAPYFIRIKSRSKTNKGTIYYINTKYIDFIEPADFREDDWFNTIIHSTTIKILTDEYPKDIFHRLIKEK